MESEFDPTPSLERVEAEVRELCRSGDLPEPDRVVDYAAGEYAALWDEQKVALIVEVEGREL